MSPSRGDRAARGRLTRRRLLLAGATIGLALAGAAAWRVRSFPGLVRERVAAKVAAYRYPHLGYRQAIISQFPYLDIDPAGLDRFVQDYARVFGAKTWTTALDQLFEVFLMSSDFFPNGADETRTVRYVALYAPGETICYNPLAEFD